MKMRMRMCVRGVFAVKLQLAASNTFDRGLLSPELLGEQSGLDYAPMPKKKLGHNMPIQATSAGLANLWRRPLNYSVR